MKLVKWTIRIAVLAVLVIAIQSAAVTAKSGVGLTENGVRQWMSVFTGETVSAAEMVADKAVDVKDMAFGALSARTGAGNTAASGVE